MSNKSFLQKVKQIPVPILPTMVGALTLSPILGKGLWFIGLIFNIHI